MRTSTVLRLVAALVAVAVIGVAVLVGYEEDYEGDEILLYDKGTYLGKPDRPVDLETLEELRERVRRQSGV